MCYNEVETEEGDEMAQSSNREPVKCSRCGETIQPGFGTVVSCSGYTTATHRHCPSRQTQQPVNHSPESNDVAAKTSGFGIGEAGRQPADVMPSVAEVARLRPTAELVRCSCGHKVPRAQVMWASLGTACEDCYDRMSG